MIAPEPFFEPRGTPFSILGRLKALSQLGHDVDLLTYPVGQDVTIPGVEILRTPVLPLIRDVPVGPSWRKVVLDVFLFFKAFRILSKKRYDFLHTHEEAGFFGVFLGKLYKIPHLYDMHSSLPEQLMNFEFTRLRGLIRLFEWLECRVIRSSKIVITVCPELAKHVQEIAPEVPRMTIENSLVDKDFDDVSEEDVQALKAAFSLAGKAVILYTGTLEPYQGVDLLVASAEEVLGRRDDVLFVLVGGKPKQVRRYQDRVKELGLLAHFRFAGAQPKEAIPGFIRLADVLVSPRTTGKNTPSKIYSYLNSGKAIVATDIVAHTQALSSETALIVQPDPDSMAQAILSILDHPELGTRLGRQGREFFEKHHDFQLFIRKTKDAVQIALAKRPNEKHEKRPHSAFRNPP